MAKRLNKNKKPTSTINEGNLYDKIFKEDAEEIFLPLIEMKLGVKIKSFKPFKAKMQTTLEREMDFFYEVETIEDKKLLVHIEFQTEDDMEILYRKGEYHGIALNLKKMEIKHIVIYLGIKEPLMPTKLPEEQVYRGFDLIDVHALDHQQLLASQVPDVIILAVLADYPPEKAESVLRLILRQLKTACKSTSELSKYIKQLVVLSRLRKIEDLTIKITEDMPISYDVETDYLYKKGTEKGMEREKIEVICQARQEGSSIEYIAKIVRLSPEQVRQILDNLKIK
jgi:predicted transposase YdaD